MDVFICNSVSLGPMTGDFLWINSNENNQTQQAQERLGYEKSYPITMNKKENLQGSG